LPSYTNLQRQSWL